MTIDFSLIELLDQNKCYDFLVEILHPDGLRCPNGHGLEETHIHRHDRAPILLYRCDVCGRFFNAFTETTLQGTRYSVVQIVQLLQGIVKGESTARLAREMKVSRRWLMDWRHKLQAFVEQIQPTGPLPDTVVEADEMYQNAGEKKRPSSRSSGPSQASC
jgi:transposase-like protein